MKTKTYLALALGLALSGVAAGCGDESNSDPDGGNLGGMGGTIGNGGNGGTPGTGGNGGTGGTGGMNPDGGAPDMGVDAEPEFGAFVIDLIKNQTNETAMPTSLEGRTFRMTDDITTFVELLK